MKPLAFGIIAIMLSSCQPAKQSKETEYRTFRTELAEELKAMVEIDQIAAFVRKGEYTKLTDSEWEAFKDSVFTTHTMRLKEILQEFGYPGYDLVGKEGAQHFWLMVQHADKDVEFQMNVLRQLKAEVDKNNADPSNFALLTDRVQVNTGKKQVYGTQVTYNQFGQAYPKALADSSEVNKRRAEVGLGPIEEYLNTMTLMHFEINKEQLQQAGITEPKLYPVIQPIDSIN